MDFPNQRIAGGRPKPMPTTTAIVSASIGRVRGVGSADAGKNTQTQGAEDPEENIAMTTGVHFIRKRCGGEGSGG